MTYWIDCTDIHYAAGHTAILKGISFHAQKGEFIGICGPNGAGKSTMLRIIGGILRPSQGEILIKGKPIRAYQPRALAHEIALMHQDTHVGFDFTVREIVLLGRYPHRSLLSRYAASDYSQVDRALALAQCSELSSRKVSTLSGGELQRVMLARAFAQDTDILLLDEPTSSLDVRFSEQTFDSARRFAANDGLVISVIHDLRTAAAHCDRILLMHGGSLLRDGSPRESLTSEALGEAYAIHAAVFDNPVGQWDYYIKP